MVFFTATGNAQAFCEKTFGGSSFERGESVQQTSDWGYIVAGSTTSFGPGGYNFYLIKIDSSGTEQWSNTFGRGFSDRGAEVQQTSDGGYVVVGITCSGGPTNTCDAWLVKTNSSGETCDYGATGNCFESTEKFAKTFGGPFWDEAHDVQQTNGGGYIITGRTNPLDDGNGDLWLIKIDSSGNEIWSRTFSPTDHQIGHSVDRTSDGGYIITGQISAPFQADVWLLKTDSSGIEQWSNTFGGGPDNDNAYSVQQTSDGYIITGYTVTFGAEHMDVWLIKTDSSGNEQWNKTFGGADPDVGWSVNQTTDGGYVITGNTWSFGAGNDGAWLIKTDLSGDTCDYSATGSCFESTEKFVKTIGGGESTAYSVQQTDDGGYVVAGLRNPPFCGAAGNIDLWLVKTDASGDYPTNCYVCGNGILEPQCGEECDDGNTINKDGCDSSCNIEDICIGTDAKDAAIIGVNFDSGDLYIIDSTDTSKTLITTVNETDLGSLYMHSNGKLYSINPVIGGSSELYAINITDGSATLIADGIGETFEGGLTIAPDRTVYASNKGVMADAVIFTLDDLTTGNVVNLIPLIPAPHDIGGLIARDDGMLIGLDNWEDRLVEINPATGETTEFNALDDPEVIVGSVGGMTVFNGVGYFVTAGFGALNPGDDSLYSFDLYTGEYNYVNAFMNASGNNVGAGLGGLATIPCPAPICGNGVIQTGEECDDGNNNDFDGCRNDCTFGLLVIPIHTILGEGELYAYQGDRDGGIGTTFQVGSDRDQVLIFTYQAPGGSTPTVKVNGVEVVLNPVDSAGDASAYYFNVSLGSNITIEENAGWKSWNIGGYIAQDPAYDINQIPFLIYTYDSIGSNSMYLVPGDYSYVYFDKELNASEPITVTLEDPGGTIILNETYGGPSPAPANNVVVGTFTAGVEGMYNLNVNVEEDGVYWVYVTSQVPICGNGALEIGEQCESGNPMGVECDWNIFCNTTTCTCPALAECDWEIGFNTSWAVGTEYMFDVNATDLTTYGDNTTNCDEYVSNDKMDIDFDIWIKRIEGNPDVVNLTLQTGESITDAGKGFKELITIPIQALEEQVGTLYVKLPVGSTAPVRVTVTATKVEEPSANQEIVPSQRGKYFLTPVLGSTLCPTCIIEDVPYLIYHAGYALGPGMNAQETCDEAAEVIGRLEDPSYCGSGNCYPESLVYLRTAKIYYAVGADILDSGPSSQGLLEQADRYCRGAQTFARDGIYAFCVRIKNPPGCVTGDL